MLHLSEILRCEVVEAHKNILGIDIAVEHHGRAVIDVGKGAECEILDDRRYGKDQLVVPFGADDALPNHALPSGVSFQLLGKPLIDNRLRRPARMLYPFGQLALNHLETHSLYDAWFHPVEASKVEQHLRLTRQHHVVAALVLQKK